MRKITLGIALAAALAASEASAQGLSGNQLHGICADPATAGFCAGYVIGFSEFYTIAEASWRKSIAGWTPSWCRPDKATNQQLVDVVTAFLRDRPELRHELATTLVLRAFIDAFPCGEAPSLTRGPGTPSPLAATPGVTKSA